MADERQGSSFVFVMRAPATNTHVTRVSRLKTRAPQSGHRTCTPATNTAQTPKTDPTLTPTRQSPGNPAPPMSHPANGSIMRVVCGSLLRESIAHPPPLVRPRRRFVCRPRRQLSPNDGLFFPHRPSKKPRLLACFVPPLRLCRLCVCVRILHVTPFITSQSHVVSSFAPRRY